MTDAREFTPEELAQVEALAAYLTQEQIADYFGIGRTTFFMMLKRDPKAAEHYKRGKATVIRDIAKGLIQKAREGDNAAMMFYLKTQAGWRETARIEHTGADGGPIETKDASPLSVIESRLARLATAGDVEEDPKRVH